MSGRMQIFKNKFLVILIATLIALLVSPVIREMGGAGLIISALLLAGIPLASIYAFFEAKKMMVLLIILSALLILFSALSAFFPNKYLKALYLIPGILLYLIVIILILKKILITRDVTADLIFGAVSTYLLVGVMWAALYMLIELFSPGSFIGIKKQSDIAYFSFVTLTTLGFGDISPASILTQRLAIMEAAAGSIYIGVIIALIVGKYISQQIRQESGLVEKNENQKEQKRE